MLWMKLTSDFHQISQTTENNFFQILIFYFENSVDFKFNLFIFIIDLQLCTLTSYILTYFCLS